MAKKDNWATKPRAAKWASVLFPHLTTEETRTEMGALARGERKKAPAQQPLLADHARGAVSPLGGVAEPSKRKR